MPVASVTDLDYRVHHYEHCSDTVGRVKIPTDTGEELES
jgi:hypothetical protein